MALALTATPDPTTVPPSVKITLSGATGPTTLTRQAADGSVGTVRTADGQAVPAGTTSVYDYEAPFGQQLTYFGNGSTASSSVILAGTVPWLIHPGRPERSVPLTVAALESRRQAAKQGVFQVIGRARPIVVTDGMRGSVQSSLTVLTQTLAAADAMRLLLSDTQTLLLNAPASKGWGLTAEYVAIGDVEETRPTRIAAHPERLWSLPYIVVDRPRGGFGGSNGGTGGDTGTGTRTWADLALEASTWADAAALYSTWADAATGNRIG